MPGTPSGLVNRTRAREKPAVILVQANMQSTLVIKDFLRPVAVMPIDINDGHSLKACLRKCANCDCKVIEDAETARPFCKRMVQATARIEDMARYAIRDKADRLHGCTDSCAGTVKHAGPGYGVGSVEDACSGCIEATNSFNKP